MAGSERRRAVPWDVCWKDLGSKLVQQLPPEPEGADELLVNGYHQHSGMQNTSGCSTRRNL